MMKGQNDYLQMTNSWIFFHSSYFSILYAISTVNMGGYSKSSVLIYTFIIEKYILAMRASLVAQLVRNVPVMWETWVRPLGWEDPLEKGKATHSSILAWRIPWYIVHGVTKSWT